LRGQLPIQLAYIKAKRKVSYSKGLSNYHATFNGTSVSRTNERHRYSLNT